MIQTRKSDERGVAEHGWLSSRHSFSFAGYEDPRHMGFGPLRVINEDRVQAGQGFGTHAHQDMDILSYVLDGALEHRDSMGNGSVIRYGDVQLMSAGTGVRHSEFNHSKTEPVHFLQIWIIPSRRAIAPTYEEKNFDAASKRGRLRLIASSDAREGSVRLHQDASIYATILGPGDRVEHTLAPGQLAYVHLIRGHATVNGEALHTGDALKLQDEAAIRIGDAADAELLVFDLPR